MTSISFVLQSKANRGRTFGLCGFPPQRDRCDESESSDGNHGLIPLDIAFELFRTVLNRSVRRTSHGSPPTRG